MGTGCFSSLLKGGGRDVRPAAHLLSFASPKERRQRKGDPQSASPIARRAMGAACDARTWGGIAELAAFFELRSNICDELDNEACVSFGTHAHPSSCASRRSQQGWGAGTTRLLLSQPRRVSVTRCALPTPSAARRNGAERSDGPCGALNPFWTCREAQELGWRVCRRTHTLRHLARRRCLSGVRPQGERSELRGAPQLRASQVARSEAKGHGQQGRLSFGYFSLAKQRTSTSAAGPRPGLRL